MWLSQYPAIRQLLCRFFYRDDGDQRATHADARVFYEQWGSGAPAGMEQGYILVESIWHAAMAMCCGNSPDDADQLPEFAADLTAKLIRSAMYDPSEWRLYVSKLLNDDEELLRLTEPYAGLFDEVLSRVCGTIGGGG